ncbi:unnamed protein product [Candidula unifasciata]|uniref:Eukaryotic translation initiation factor 5A n=1 Tax=Candidula unifasciata TaxID=100452 RepID=A0A8S3YI69_9EUPU|nr:unnamed protein product [Candidula unifasciata]
MLITRRPLRGADAGASQTYPMQCSSLRKNGYVIVKGRPCKIVEMSTSKTGKYGHAKVHMIGIDLLTNKKYEDICPSTHKMSVLDDGGFLCLMSDIGEAPEDLKCPEGDIGQEIRERSERDE